MANLQPKSLAESVEVILPEHYSQEQKEATCKALSAALKVDVQEFSHEWMSVPVVNPNDPYDTYLDHVQRHIYDEDLKLGFISYETMIECSDAIYECYLAAKHEE